MTNKPKHMTAQFTRATEPTSQQPKAPKKTLPRAVVAKMMQEESDASPTSPKQECERCHAKLLHKFIVRIKSKKQWGDDEYVCRLCYDPKRDRRADGRYSYRKPDPAVITMIAKGVPRHEAIQRAKEEEQNP